MSQSTVSLLMRDSRCIPLVQTHKPLGGDGSSTGNSGVWGMIGVTFFGIFLTPVFFGSVVANSGLAHYSEGRPSWPS